MVGSYPTPMRGRVRQMVAVEQVPRPDDLRATAIALMLSAGVTVRAAARRAGYDPQVLPAYYAATNPTEVSGVPIALESAWPPG